MKLHLGCWTRIIPGMINVDICDYPHIDHISPIDKLPFIEDESVDLIYCSHAFEYFDKDEASKALIEWKRVLRSGGILRLAVPNFPALIEVYEKTNDLNSILGPLFGRMKVGNSTKNIFHKTVYDKSSLTSILLGHGYSNVIEWDWRKVDHGSVDDHSQAYYPHMSKESGIHISLNLEASKL